MPRLVARAATKRKSRAKERIYSFRDAQGQWDPKKPASRAVEHFQLANRQGRKHTRISAFELDRAGHLALHPR